MPHVLPFELLRQDICCSMFWNTASGGIYIYIHTYIYTCYHFKCQLYAGNSFHFDPRTVALGEVSRFFRQKTSQPRGDLNPHPSPITISIHIKDRISSWWREFRWKPTMALINWKSPVCCAVLYVSTILKTVLNWYKSQIPECICSIARPQCSIQNRMEALWDTEQAHSGICEIDLFSPLAAFRWSNHEKYGWNQTTAKHNKTPRDTEKARTHCPVLYSDRMSDMASLIIGNSFLCSPVCTG